MSVSTRGWPLRFRCFKCRQIKNQLDRFGATDILAGGKTQLTGERRPFKGDRFEYQYKCLDCGHVGWSAHPRAAARWATECNKT